MTVFFGKAQMMLVTKAIRNVMVKHILATQKFGSD